ncbi:MAG: MarR family transcriptional regulator [Chloroflexi bacterium]|uniref:MarR family winged helix-turn-helix transcriptional regulator n=1 Tax=Candidatus Flexifilum breve TaxID=3140694 RepID=UPI0031347C16|nr:MarR family transcriptional regulator [Chloroflexota bacterium]MBK9751588.1 MarR family transcriptional regulator [Chloroflexota bacterium]
MPSTGKRVDPAFERDLLHFWALLFQVVLDGEKRLSDMLGQHGLTTPQFYVLKTLIEHDGRLTIGRLAKLHGLTNATMTGLVKRLEVFDPPLVLRETNVEDRRSVYVVLTDAGRERFIGVQTDLMDQLRAVLGLLNADERRSLLFDLTRYVDMLILRA